MTKSSSSRMLHVRSVKSGRYVKSGLSASKGKKARKK